MGRVEHVFFLMELPLCFPKVNGKAACWKIGEGGGGKKSELGSEVSRTHNTNGNYVSLRDIKIIAVNFLSGFEMSVKKKSLFKLQAYKEVCSSTYICTLDKPGDL